MHSTETMKGDLIVIGLKTIMFPGVYVCTFQPGGVIGWGSDGVKVL